MWVPVIAYLLWSTVTRLGSSSPWLIPAGIFIGLFLWTLAEYTLHRFVFHFKPRNAFQERLSFLFHGVHHYQPQAKTRLVMPLPLSIPLAGLFFLLFWLVAGRLIGAPLWVGPLFAGFLIGYLVYDLIHYATHHFSMRRGYWKYIKRYHMAHHYKNPDGIFGVSSPIWDYVFKTTV
jgi:sterol desaturase/sphingolipid hydroxylase (fatty acid hydroxylase superfamily)